MAMSKKHYNAIVAAKRETVKSLDYLSTTESQLVEKAFWRFAELMAETLKRDNPNFDRARFLDAMQAESK